MLSRILGVVAGIAAAVFAMVSASSATPMPDGVIMITRTLDVQNILDGNALSATIVSFPAALLLFGSALSGIGFLGWRIKRLAA